MLHKLYRVIFKRLYATPSETREKATQTNITLQDSIVVVLSEFSW